MDYNNSSGPFLTMNFKFDQDHGPRQGPELDTNVPILFSTVRGHYMAKKDDFSYEIFPNPGSVTHSFSRFSVCYLYHTEDLLKDRLMNIQTDRQTDS